MFPFGTLGAPQLVLWDLLSFKASSDGSFVSRSGCITGEAVLHGIRWKAVQSVEAVLYQALASISTPGVGCVG